MLDTDNILPPTRTNSSEFDSDKDLTVEELLASIDHVYIDPVCKSDRVSQRMIQLFPQNKVSIQAITSRNKGDLSPGEFNDSKKNLYLTRFKGQFFKRCPGATQKRALTCCNYFVLNLGQQCNMNCSYCYLQSYLNFPMMTIYTNLDQALGELRETAERFPTAGYRVGTGEIIDSLSLDPLTLYSKELIRFFHSLPHWTLEFKTKSNYVSQFLDQPHSGNVVVSWSVNPQNIVASEEHGTASLEQRLQAARQCSDRGFPVAFHIDPMIWHKGWKQNYAVLVDQITEEFGPEDIHAISVGTLRFQPQQKAMMRRRFGPESIVVQAEMHQSESGKMRYDAQLRAEMSQFVIRRLHQKNAKYKSFICMETPENWIKSYGQLPVHDKKINSLFKPLPRIR
jgi:spore photoproduct lyase